MNHHQGKGKSPTFIVAIVLASIAVVLSFTVLAVKLTGINKKQPIENEQGDILGNSLIDAEEETSTGLGDEMDENSPEKKNLTDEAIPMEEKTLVDKNEKTDVEQGIHEMEAPIDLDSALNYVPTPGMILTYMHYYPDGDIAEVQEIIGQMEIGILSSIAEMMTDDRETLYVYHYVESEEGIYLLDNDSAEYITLWLPNKPKTGDTWEYDYMKYEILEMGVSIETGGKLFEDCIMRKETIEEMDFSRTSYIAPGYGEVYSEYEGGSVEFELIDEETDDQGLAKELMGGTLN